MKVDVLEDSLLSRNRDFYCLIRNLMFLTNLVNNMTSHNEYENDAKQELKSPWFVNTNLYTATILKELKALAKKI